MNITAHQVVACDKTVAAPRGPKAVWLPAPPNAPARSAALPLCSSTTMISTRQLSTKNDARSHPAQRQPTTINAKPTRSATPHFIQPGISQSPRILLVSRATYLVFTIVANDFGSNPAPPPNPRPRPSWPITPALSPALT